MIQLSFKPFLDFLKENTIERTRSRFMDSIIQNFQMEKTAFHAIVRGSKIYHVAIEFDAKKVKKATCSCPYEGPGACKHIVNAIVKADQQLRVLKEKEKRREEEPSSDLELHRIDDKLILENQPILELSEMEIARISAPRVEKHYAWDTMRILNAEVFPDHLSGVLYNPRAEATYFNILQKNGNAVLMCSCDNTEEELCGHLNFLLNEILEEREYQLPFDHAYRHSLLKRSASEMGMDNPDRMDELFEITIEGGRVFVESKVNVLNLNSETVKSLKQELIPEFQFPKSSSEVDVQKMIVVSENHYADRIDFKWMQAPLTKAGKIKSPVTSVDILEEIRTNSAGEALPFYLALLEQKMSDEVPELNKQLAQSKQIIRNPFDYSFYVFENKKHFVSKITAKSLRPIEVKRVETSATIFVEQQNDYYVLTCSVKVENNVLSSKRIKLTGLFYYWQGDTLNLIDNPAVIRIINFFDENKHELFIHTSQFSRFREDFLQKLEQSISVKYDFVKKAPKRVVKEQSLDTITEYMIYLSESEDYIVITPVVAYGETEVAAMSRKTIYAENPAGGLYEVERKDIQEERFVRTIREQHPLFEDQNGVDFFYLHKQEFLESGWFLDAFEKWRKSDYSILGFSQLSNNKLNAHKMAVQTSVNSGIDWFEVHAKVSFGDQEVTLKDIQKSVLNKTRYVKLGDGSLGIMPNEWIEKFGAYFRSGEIKGDFIKTHHSNFQLIDDLFELEVLSKDAQLKLEDYKEKLASFQSIQKTEVPKTLNATLRDYQKEGLNWLNFLDEFGFGGCLADDMGLGKTIQIIAYLLQQIEKGNTAPNLVVVPTSLLFNWQVELDKFAPHLKRLVVYGPNRNTKKMNFSNFDIVLTTYGTMLSDIEHLKEFTFNCVVLDESQAIKNPSSKRYKAARLLKGRQRLVMTGTPIENNTFDLYAQLSFAIPGLFGSAQRFKDLYSTPIDKFKETKRAKELQRKIHPFVLRRTKTQVAKELPEKTEIVLHCEMGKEQQRVYDAYKREFQLYLNKQETESLNKNSLHILQGLTKLRQICNSPSLLSDDEYYGGDSAKLNVLMEQVNMLKDDHKILIFSQFVRMLDLVKSALAKEKIKYAYLTGQTKNREDQVEAFQEDDDVRVFLISLKAGGTGLNLTKAEYVFLIDPWWNPAVENQAIDRAHRIGQDNKVVAVRLITPNTIEEKILELQSRKKELVQELVHTDTNILKQLTKEDLIEML